MSFGDSKRSRYGGISELTGQLSNDPGEVVATDASLERKGSLRLTGGMAIFVALLELRAQQAALLLMDGDAGDGAKELIVSCRTAAIMAILVESLGGSRFQFKGAEGRERGAGTFWSVRIGLRGWANWAVIGPDPARHQSDTYSPA